MIEKQLLPKNKDDFESVNKLKNLGFNEFSDHIEELLKWIQDMNWPISKEIADILSKYTNQIEDNIIEILRTDDDIWKYWCIQELLLYSKEKKISLNLINELKRIINKPTVGETEEEVDIIAKETLNKYK